MKLSEAIMAGVSRAPVQLCKAGYFDFDTTGPPVADVLFTAYLGLPNASVASVVHTLGLDGSNRTAACRMIQDGLFRAWPVLGAKCPERLCFLAKRNELPSAKRHESLFAYLARLNDRTQASREDIAALLERYGL